MHSEADSLSHGTLDEILPVEIKFLHGFSGSQVYKPEGRFPVLPGRLDHLVPLEKEPLGIGHLIVGILLHDLDLILPDLPGSAG